MNIIKAIILTLILTPITLISQETLCPDVDDYTEHPVLKRYNNSCVIGFNEIKYESARLPIAQQSSSKDETKHLTIEGKITDILFAIENNGKATVLEVHRNYETALRNSEMEILYSCNGRKDCFTYGSGNFTSKNPDMGDNKYLEVWKNQKLKHFRFALSRHHSNQNGDESYFVAQGKKDSKKYTIAILIRYNRTSWKALNGNIFVFAKIIEEDIMDTDQVSVASIDEKIKNEGKEVFNNIHFEFGSAKLKNESLNIISTISEYLKANSDRVYYIVGHTDNVGALSSNQTLSEQRAAVVRSVLIKTHGIIENQISAHGVGQLSPAATNSTEEGRSLNRRVEIVIK